MDYLPTLINALVVGAVGLLITYLTRTQIQDLRSELKGEIAEFRAEVRIEFSDVKQDTRDVRGELAGLRSDLTQVALAVGARPRPQTG